MIKEYNLDRLYSFIAFLRKENMLEESVGNLVNIYIGIVAVFLVILVFLFWKKKDKGVKSTIELVVTVVLALMPIGLTFLAPEQAISVAFPDIEKYIKQAEDLEKENKELAQNIVELQKENTKVKEKNDLLSEKKYAEIINSELVVDGLSLKAKNNFLATIDSEKYIHENILKEVTGKDVQFDEEQNKIFIGSQDVNKVTKVNFKEVSKILYDGDRLIKYDDENADTFVVAGKEYDSGFVLDANEYSDTGAIALFNLDGSYSKVDFDVGKIDSSSLNDVKMKVYLDGEVSEQHALSSQVPSTKFSIPVNSAKSLKIQLVDGTSNFGFYDIVFTK
ncbi:NPCBM/NEW2 domain-containing protein [Vagococcus sp. BWB3-3]|uniref:NPCBM/NEW2 domain-containing protein n=1 Tax=Vagococcus allomyrinae TaxID=2794353 RepID=A0A940P9M3_9ENTE|nr:NPCBM/NEW2 domain-containing protein [Vagococcus allomyrinae]MBP1040989.1 NPCBM/NEW2 domain-containing protein [Vagococcus allomyrinae]